MKPQKETDKSRLLNALNVRNSCPVAKKCGGCSFAGKTYFEQSAAKEKRVKKLISPFCEVLPIHHSEEPLYYRNKVHSAFKKLKNGRIICGPYESGSHRIVETDTCFIENKKATAIIRDCAEIAERLKISIYNEVKGEGDLRRVLVRTADATGEIMVVLIIGSTYFKKKKAFTDELLRLHPEITTLLININKRHDSMILGSDEVKKVTGKPIKFIGTGEKLNEFEEFHPDRMASRILGMGDVLSIIEQAEETLSHEEAERLEKKLMKNKELDLNDYLAQLKQIKKMGPLSSIIKLIPGMGQYADKVDDKELVKVESIICSMTNEERENPRILNGQRRLRIAKGSGTQVQDINKFMQAFETTRDMMKKVSKGKIDPKMKKMMKSMNLDQLSEGDIEDLEKKLGKK